MDGQEIIETMTKGLENGQAVKLYEDENEGYCIIVTPNVFKAGTYTASVFCHICGHATIEFDTFKLLDNDTTLCFKVGEFGHIVGYFDTEKIRKVIITED